MWVKWGTAHTLEIFEGKAKLGEHFFVGNGRVIRPGVPLRKMEPNWPGRGMQFVDLSTGDVNLSRYVELLVNIGYPQRY